MSAPAATDPDKRFIAFEPPERMTENAFHAFAAVFRRAAPAAG
jgi:hypothetical protein